MTRKVHVKKIKDAVRELCLRANFNLRPDILKAIKKSLKAEKNRASKKILKILIENAGVAKREKRAICQDTGVIYVHIEIGQDVKLIGGHIDAAVNKGVEEAYKKGGLRKSVVKSALLRVNTGTGAPAFIYTEVKKGDKVRITVMPKGFGSENKSRISMLNPTHGENEIISFVTDVVKKAGPDACPPYVLGIGIGGTFDTAAALSKTALTLPIDKRSKHKHIEKLRKKILKKVNALNIGPMGFGGKATCLGVNVLEAHTHIAGLPVAVNVSCHATRGASKII